MTEALIGFAGTVLAVLIPLMWRQGRKLNAVHEQVTNSHPTNLRDDIDSLRNEVRSGFAALHGEIALERTERIALAERLEKK